MPAPPTVGNMLVALQTSVPAHDTLTVATPPDGWTTIGFAVTWDGGISDLVQQIFVKCVDATDAESENVNIGGGSFAHWTSVSEWGIA